MGDAANAVDPLYSTGLVMTSLQATQVSDIISKNLMQTLEPNTIKDYEKAFFTIFHGSQKEISQMYEIMNDPYRCSWRMHYSSLFYFFLLPNYINKNHLHSQGARWITAILQNSDNVIINTRKLLEIASTQIKDINTCDISNQYLKSVNWKLMGADQSQLKVFFKTLREFHQQQYQHLGIWQKMKFFHLE